MNYYEHHLGDYAEATAHLSFVEDAAYSRMIRKYYATEKPLPSEKNSVQRLIGARTKDEKEAVSAVLDEFFVLRDDGWHNTRCDEEIARFQDKQEKAKRSAEARWNKQKPHSEGNANASPDAMRTHSEGNAHQTPDTRHQSPVNPEVIHRVSESESHQRETPPDSAPVPPSTPAGEACLAIREAGIQTTNPSHPTLIALINAGADADEFRIAAREAVAKGKADFAYVIGTVRKRREEAAALVLHQGRMPTARGPTASGNTREARISNYAAEAALARGEHENEHGTGRTERDITGESVRIA